MTYLDGGYNGAPERGQIEADIVQIVNKYIAHRLRSIRLTFWGRGDVTTSNPPGCATE